MPHVRALLHIAMNQNTSHTPDLLGLYLDEAGSFPLLTKADEMRLGKTIQEGQEAAARLAGAEKLTPSQRREPATYTPKPGTRTRTSIATVTTRSGRT